MENEESQVRESTKYGSEQGLSRMQGFLGERARKGFGGVSWGQAMESTPSSAERSQLWRAMEVSEGAREEKYRSKQRRKTSQTRVSGSG